MRIFANYRKGEAMRFLSHLDIQRLLQRGLRRAQLPVAYSNGFNPHPLLSFASALPVGCTGDGEWVDIRLEREIPAADFVARMNAVLPEGFSIRTAMEAPETLPTLTVLTDSAAYEVTAETQAALTEEHMRQTIDTLLAEPIIVNKRTKGGMKDVDIRPQVLGLSLLSHTDGVRWRFRVSGMSNAQGSLNIGLLMQALFAACNTAGSLLTVHRTGLFFTGTDLLPQAAVE